MFIKRFVLTFTTLAFFWAGLVAPVQGAVLATGDYLQASERQANLAVVDRAMMRADVQQQLSALGVDPADAMHRAASLSDQELAAFAEQIDALPAGGDSLLAIVGIVFIVLLILDLTGVTDIFSKI